MPHFATRATLLSAEVLRSKGMYAEAAAQLIKMTSEVIMLSYLSMQLMFNSSQHPQIYLISDVVLQLEGILTEQLVL